MKKGAYGGGRRRKTRWNKRRRRRKRRRGKISGTEHARLWDERKDREENDEDGEGRAERENGTEVARILMLCDKLEEGSRRARNEKCGEKKCKVKTIGE